MALSNRENFTSTETSFSMLEKAFLMHRKTKEHRTPETFHSWISTVPEQEINQPSQLQFTTPTPAKQRTRRHYDHGDDVYCFYIALFSALVPHETAAVSARSVYIIQPCTMSLHAKPHT